MKKEKIINREYSDIYYNRALIGVKSCLSPTIGLLIILAAAGIAVLFLLPVFSGAELTTGTIIVAAVCGAAILAALIRIVFWLAYPRKLIAVEPGRVILFPGGKSGREKILPLSEVSVIRQNDWWSLLFVYNNYSITLATKYNGYHKLRFVKSSPQVVAKLKQLKYNRPV
ncbi:MAG: hypothetical protein LBT30_05310 [Clostridiales bacterium]|jgi:hypothetical protein|nr:hypothetical protein [Clostridiales bacterium]